MAKIIFGLGYLGLRIAEQWIRRSQPQEATSERIYAVTRSPEKGALLEQRGLCPVVGDIAAEKLPLDAGISTAVIAIGYDRGSSQPIGEVYARSAQNIVDSLSDSVERVIYISSTGVFGRASGEWVSEETPAEPLREGGKACLAAENILRQSRLSERVTILRLAGIYGPDRIPRRADLAAGRAIDAAPDGYLNLIHVDDAASIVLAVDDQKMGGELFLVSDGSPTLRRDYYAELARIVGGPPPQFATPAIGSPAAARAASDKRISNAKLMAQLKPVLAYPSYQEGLAAIVREEDSRNR